MKFFVIGDTHGHLDKVLKVWERLKGVDMVIHTGDHLRDAKDLEAELGVPVIGVKGNCDGSMSSDDIEIVESEYGNILVTHGHMQGVDYSYDRLLYLAEENDCVAAIFGHTHVPCYDQIDDIYLINPGSLTRPRDGSQGSYAIITTTESTFAASIVYYDRFGSKGNVQGGFVKNILNYSDRF